MGKLFRVYFDAVIKTGQPKVVTTRFSLEITIDRFKVYLEEVMK